MKKFYLLTLLISVHSFSQSLVRIEPENFSTIYGFGGSGSFNDAEIVISGQNAMPPTGVPKLYLFNTDSSGINPNGTIDSPEVNQSFGGAIEMKDDYLFAGSIRNNTNAENGGAVYVFKKVNGNWEYLLKIQPSTQYENDYFGTNIKVHNNQLFITAFGYDENGDASINDGAVYIYNQNGDTFSLQQTLTGVSGNSGFGTLLEIENDILVTTSTNSTDDFITTFNQQSSNWELVNSTLMPNVSFEFNPELSLLHSDRVSLSNGKLYIYHLTDTENDFLGLKMVKIHDWSYASDEWSFVEDFVFQEGDYYEYKVKVGGNNMFLIPTGEYILMMERKNPVFHFVNENGSWSYVNAYSGMSSYTHDNFGHFTLIKENQVLFGNSGEYWTIPVAASNGGAYMLDVTLGINEFEVNNLVVYPNPTDGIVKIYFKNSEVASIEIYDGIGKKVLEKKANVQEFDISGLNSGIYFCKITNSDNSIKFQKIIKK
jgi:hypothetical protein